MNYIHESNFKTKINANYKNVGEELHAFFDTVYHDMRKQIEQIDLNESQDSFVLFASIANDYLKELDEFINDNGITSQSKFRSTFLEELSIYLFKNIDAIRNDKFNFFNKGIFAGIKLDTNGNLTILKKDVDFCIGKKIDLLINDEKHEELIIPLVAVEVKTYLDATMFAEVQFSCREIKNASPNVRTYILMEYNQVSTEKLLKAKYENTINEIFSLRSARDSMITARALEQYYNEIKTFLDFIEDNSIIVQDGKILHQ